MKDYVRVHLRGGCLQALLTSVLLFVGMALAAAVRLDASASVTDAAVLVVLAKAVTYVGYAAVGLAALWNAVVLAIAFTALGGKSTPPASFVMLSMIVRLSAIAGLAFCAYTRAAIPFGATAGVALLVLLFVKAPKRKSPAT